MSKGDMFLKIDGAKQGPIKGEAQDREHASEIDILGWSWGMRAQTGMGAGGETGKSTLQELTVAKRVDSANEWPPAGRTEVRLFLFGGVK
jgi:type VI secretion system secreted protein Hcp